MYNKNHKDLKNEIIRMLQVSNFGKSASQINENNVSKKLIKEDFVTDLADIFAEPEEESDDDLGTDGQKYIMPIELKAAMLAHSLSEYQAGLLGVYTEWRAKTSGTNAATTPGAVMDKEPENKLDRLSKEKDRIMKIGKDANKHTPHANYEKEWEKIIKSRRVIVTFAGDEARTKDMTSEEKAQTAKWLEKKTFDIISMSGNKLTPMGKAQIEFLARALSGKHIDEKEKALFKILNDDGYHFSETAEEILRQFYSLALIPYIMVLTRRAKYNPSDMQLHEFIEEGVNHALNKMRTGAFDPSRGGVGSFIIEAGKNAVINELIKISDYKLDTRETNDFFYNNKPPYVFTSTAAPDEVNENNYIAVEEKEPEGRDYLGRRIKAIYAYTYDDAYAAYEDLIWDARSGRKKASDPNKPEDLDADTTNAPVDKSTLPSPLSKRFLTSETKQKFYKSFAPTYNEIKDTMGLGGVTDPYETMQIFSLKEFPEQAKKELDKIFNKIIQLWIQNDKEIGELEQSLKNNPELNIGHEIRSNRAIRNQLKIVKYTDIIKELMYDILNYGEMVEVYTVAWPLPNSKTKVPVGRPVKYTTAENGQKIPVPNIYGEIPEPGDTEMVWNTRIGLNDFIKPEFRNKFLAKMQAKIPAQSKEWSYFVTHSNDIINKALRAIRYYFGYDGVENPYIRQNMEDMKIILKNYATAAQAKGDWSTRPKTPREKEKEEKQKEKEEKQKAKKSLPPNN